MLQKLDIVILQHTGKPGGGPHYDLRIQVPGDKNLFYSWALKYKPPKPLEIEEHGGRIIAIQTALHKRDAAYYTGPYKESNLKIYYKGRIGVIKERLNRGNKGGKHFIVFFFLDGPFKNQKWILYELDKIKHIWTLFRGKDIIEQLHRVLDDILEI